MPAPRIAYRQSKQNQLAGIPMKPSGPISERRWVELLSETAQYSREVADEGLGWGGFGGFGRSIGRAVGSVARTVARPIVAVARIAPVVTRPVVDVTHVATQTIKSAGAATLSLAHSIPGVSKRPSSAPSEWPATVNGHTVASQAEYDRYLATDVYVNPYSHKPISEQEYNLWLSAGANNSFVPVGWSVGQPAPTQAQIDAMKTADYADGYRPATDAEFKAYVAAVDAGNAAATGAVAPTTIAEVKPISLPSAVVPVTAAPVAPVTITQAAQLPAPVAADVSTPVIAPVQSAQVEPLTLNQAAAGSGTQSQPPAAAPGSSGAPIGLLAAAGAAAFFLFKK